MERSEGRHLASGHGSLAEDELLLASPHSTWLRNRMPRIKEHLKLIYVVTWL